VIQFADGVYRVTNDGPVFQPIPAPTTDQLQADLTRIITKENGGHPLEGSSQVGARLLSLEMFFS